MAPAVTRRIKRVKDWREARAKTLNMDASLVLSKAAMNAIAEINPSQLREFRGISDLRNWQKKEFGEEILHVLHKPCEESDGTRKGRRARSK